MLVSVVFENHLLVIYIDDKFELKFNKNLKIAYLFEGAFHKLLYIKDEINLLCYY